MSEPSTISLGADQEPEPPPSRARRALLRRLADVVCLPLSRVNTFERAVTADLLVEMLREASAEDRVRVANRLANLTEIPPTLARLLLRDTFEVANVLLANSASLSDAELVDCVRRTTHDHRKAVAQRRGVSDVVAEALIAVDLEPEVVEALLRNDLARLSADAVETLVAATRNHPRILPLLLRRAELRPSHAYVLFWWADAEARRQILQRFAVSREVMQEAAGDVFSLAAEESWQDPLSRKALQFIERRQRNRAAIEKSPFDSLEAAIAAAEPGLSSETAEEISYLSGVKPMTGAKIFADVGGEPIAILCKATGLPKSALRSLWRGLGRPETDPDGGPDPALERVLVTYDMIAVDRAQTVLRYWNWSLSSALTPALLKAIEEGGAGVTDEYSVPQRTAMLAFSGEFGR
ncbi:DUF2336 domain-containing protein [Phenylobacterium montanum]|uniref:DUF2336 domain-containing protein n=1 Tax=Phenylobacterium montanum TaxID=2823693 RepID=A0A975IVA4_9CAUL|nr:DUF2336 domain-containing protein [Caulobacter sp. S6]QUD87106.1 DUF2336 domain-containing protein [Caulobacter sp. S6]